MTLDKPYIRTERTTSGNVWGLLAMLGLMVVLAGCGADSDPAEEEKTISTADDVLHEMIEIYQAAESYSDRGVVRLKYRLDGQWVQDDGKFAVKYVRPNMLQLRAYQLTMVSDGKQTHAIIADQQSGDMDGQVLMKATPPVLQLGTLYEDHMVLNTIAGGMGGPPATLEMLMGEEPLAHLFDPGSVRQLLDEDEVRGHPCYRVQVRAAGASLVFWIDRKSFVLRRLEYPSDGVAQQMAEAMDCSDVSLVAEFRDACINGPLYKDEFQFQVPDAAKLVSQFVVPPQPLASDLIGRLPDAFAFSDLDGQEVKRDSMLGHATVLVWFNNHPASQITIRQIDQVRRQQPSTSQVAFYAVCTEPTHVGNSELKTLGEQWGSSLPIVRDLEAFGRDVFHVPWAPTLVILDDSGIVQAFEVGANPKLNETLPDMLRQLAEGKSLARDMLAKYEEERASYARKLEQFSAAVPTPGNRQSDSYSLQQTPAESSGSGESLIPLPGSEPSYSGDRSATKGEFPPSHR